MDFGLVHAIERDSLDEAARQLWEALLPFISYLSADDKALVELAFIQMVEAHGEQRRKSGDFYITHPVAACSVLARMQLDRDTLASSLLHDVPEDTDVSLRDLEKQFNKEIVFLISGVTKLSVIKYQGEDRYAENLRRMFIAMSRDIRVIFIKLADRIHNLSTLDALPEHKARRIARESLEIYAPIAERLGIGTLKDEIEDTAFPFVYPEEYKQLISRSEAEYRKRRKYTDKLVKRIQRMLEEGSVPYTDVYGRAKRYYSLYKKMEEGEKSLQEIYDLIAFRIITDTLEHCYQILSVLHQEFEPVQERVKDYIARPKPNGYQSIHTTLVDRQMGATFEAQIRTRDMHEYAEYGVAAHWAYKQDGTPPPESLDAGHLKWIQDLVHLGKEELSEEEYLQNVKLDLYQNEIFVLTPQGDAINLPENATPLDFAYRIHGEVGHHASMAKVNGYPVKLSYALQNGDLVEIITDRKKKPRRDWLQWVKTRGARHDIRAALRKQGMEI
jgi:GTP pyrophosphokinase